jgi:hypothetical protein
MNIFIESLLNFAVPKLLAEGTPVMSVAWLTDSCVA